MPTKEPITELERRVGDQTILLQAILIELGAIKDRLPKPIGPAESRAAALRVLEQEQNRQRSR